MPLESFPSSWRSLSNVAPTTHVAVAAAIAHLCPRPALAIAADFASHFLLDTVFHFEAFYPLSRVLGLTHQETFWLMAAVMGVLLVPSMAWIARKDRDVCILTIYAIACSAALLAPGYWNRLIALSSLTLGAWALGGKPKMTLWLSCAFAAAVPDALKHLIGPVGNFHGFMHYAGADDLGYWINRLFGQPDPDWFGTEPPNGPI